MSVKASARLLLACGLLAGSAAAAHAQSWESPLFGRELVLVGKTTTADPSLARPLSPAVQARLGPDFVEYDAFVAARLPAAEAKALREAAIQEGWDGLLDSPQPVALPFHTFHPEKPQERDANWKGQNLRPAPVQGLFLARFAFPVREEWYQALAQCGAGKLVYFGNSTFLVRAPNLGAIRSCGVARYLAWVSPYLTTDRISPDLLGKAEPAEYWLQFLPATEWLTALAELPAAMEVLEDYRPRGEEETPAKLSLRVRAGSPELEALVRTSPSLLAVLPVAEGGPSDERQGQILAGLHDGTKVLPLGPTVPHYTAWLQSRGLDGTTNQQTVAVFDTGYDDGTGAAGSNHPDLENPKRLTAAQNFVPGNVNSTAKDAWGHGTAVSAIVAGDGIGTGVVDSKGFYRGTGIAPKAKIVMAQIWDDKTSAGCELTNPLTLGLLESAFNFSRSSGSNDLAFISNHSWNTGNTSYDTYAEFYDQRALDADTIRSGTQGMSLIVSAGNNGPLAGSLRSPANAKNVIATGAAQSYRPVSTSLEPDAPPLACSPPSSLPAEDAVNVSKVSDFSARGVAFTALTAPGVKTVLNTRVKPDIVMPGGRAMSTVPYNSPYYTCQLICRKYWPDPPAPGYHSYMNGTSFAAPVASGAVALLRKWFLDRNVTAVSPSLLKAALIATGDDLGAFNALYANDHRPSYIYGWGRGNLDRATDAAARFYVTDNLGLAVGTGGLQTWTKLIDSASRGTFIVLVWSDPASTPGSSLEPPLVNDLQLYVTSTSGTWYGNVFNEAVSTLDNGYSYKFTTGFGFNDTMNNVEAIFIPAGTFAANQQITIRVTGVNVANGPQKFAVYAYNVKP